MRQLRVWLNAAYRAFETAYMASFVGRVVLSLGAVVFLVLIQAFELRPLDTTFTGDILIDFPVAFTLSITVAIAFGFVLFGLYVGLRSLFKALLSRRHQRPPAASDEQ